MIKRKAEGRPAPAKGAPKPQDGNPSHNRATSKDMEREGLGVAPKE
jgi:hypothetical protein